MNRSPTSRIINRLTLPLLLALLLLAQTREAEAQATKKGFLELDGVIRAELLTRAPWAALGPGGQLFVAQPVDLSVPVFDSAGNLVRRIGREGEGPGEFLRISGIGFLGDTLWVADRRLLRVTFFLGDQIWTEPLRVVQAGPWLSPGVPRSFFSDGAALAWPTAVSEDIAQGRVSSLPVVRLERDGRSRTLAMLDVSNSEWAVYVRDWRGYSAQPFSDAPLLRAAGDGRGFYIVDRRPSVGFGVSFFSELGDTLWHREFQAERAEITRTEVDSIVTRRAQSLPRQLFGPVASVKRPLREALFLPERRRAVARADGALDGSLWVRMERGDRACWWVINQQGRLEGSLALPPQNDPAGLLVATDSLLWLRRWTDLDLEYIERYRVEWRNGSQDELC